MTTAKWVTEIDVTDPDTKQPITLSVGKHENGAMFAIDSSYLEQVAATTDGTDDGDIVIPDPFGNADGVTLLIVEGEW